MNSKQKRKISYQDSGVSISRADTLINSLSKGKAKYDKNVLSTIGGFSSLYRLSKEIEDPVIVSGTDGVGTKLRIAKKLKNHKYIGQDLVAMCVNDIVTCGAKPLFFLDYLATSKINQSIHSVVLNSIKKACHKCDISLIGGETAEMPGMYNNEDYDLAGFCIGVVSEKKIISPKKIRNGNIILGIVSSGFHSNGYSLINKLIDKNRLSLRGKFGTNKMSSILVKPTRLYADIVCALTRKIKINGLAHITGGGITDNVPRIIPDGLTASINLNALKIPKIFRYIQELSKINDQEMLNTFNCGIGMIAVIEEKDLSAAHKILKSHRFSYRVVGHIIKEPFKSKLVYVD